MEKSTVDRLIEQAENNNKSELINEEELKDLQKACQQVFSTREGKVVMKAMRKVCGLYSFPDLDLKHEQLIFQKGKIFMYKFFVLGMVKTLKVDEIEKEVGNA